MYIGFRLKRSVVWLARLGLPGWRKVRVDGRVWTSTQHHPQLRRPDAMAFGAERAFKAESAVQRAEAARSKAEMRIRLALRLGTPDQDERHVRPPRVACLRLLLDGGSATAKPVMQMPGG